MRVAFGILRYQIEAMLVLGAAFDHILNSSFVFGRAMRTAHRAQVEAMASRVGEVMGRAYTQVGGQDVAEQRVVGGSIPAGSGEQRLVQARETASAQLTRLRCEESHDHHAMYCRR